MTVEPLTPEEHAALVAAKLTSQPLRFRVIYVDREGRMAGVWDERTDWWAEAPHGPSTHASQRAEYLNAKHLAGTLPF